MDIGQTFFFEGEEFAIKRIIVPGGTDGDGVVYNKGRIDASKFVGEGVERRIQRGRPKMFDYAPVAEILGESTIPDSVQSDLEEEDNSAIEEWKSQRDNSEKIKSFMENYGVDKFETVPSDEDF